MKKPDRVIVDTRKELFETAARRVVAILGETLGSQARASVALAGGSTPEGLYRLLATPEYASRIAWDRVELFWGDERMVPIEDPRSNYRMTQEALLQHLDLKPGQVHRIPVERMEPARAAAAYEEDLRHFFCRGGRVDAPRFDLVLLGLGTDGHIASLFPGSRSLTVTDRWAVGVERPADVSRVSLTFPVLNAARTVLFLVAGEDKAPAVSKIMDSGGDVRDWPARGVRPTDGKLLWLLDREAGALVG